MFVLARNFDVPPPLSTVHVEMWDEAIRTICGRSTGQVFVFHLEQRSTKRPIYVHAKLMITDDCYAAVGSANINRRNFATDSQLHLGVVDDATVPGTMDGSRVTVCKFAKELRLKLWQEHLGIGNAKQLEDPIKALSHWPDCSK